MSLVFNFFIYFSKEKLELNDARIAVEPFIFAEKDRA